MLSGVLAAGALATGVAVGWLAVRGGKPACPHSPPAPATQSPTRSAAAALDAGILLAPAQRDALAALLLSRDDFAHDLVFLLAASLRDRCNPAHAHELARMAVAARLPLLEGTTTTLQQQPELRGAAYALVDRLTAIAPCGHPLDISIGRYRVALNPERYATAFPDSYFDPDLVVPPPDIADRDLRERAADPCTPIVYAAFPLDAARAWGCQGLRITLRRRLVRTCATGLRDMPDADARARQLAASIHDELEKLPAICQ